MTDDEVRQAVEQMPYGTYIVGSTGNGDVNGMMAEWVMQVSFNPRLVAVSFENDARTLGSVRATGEFTLNLLPQSHEAMEMARGFAQPYLGSKVTGRSPAAAVEVHRKLEHIAYRATRGGCPVLDAAMLWLDCKVEQVIPAGDHTLVIARVVDGRVEREAEPLTSVYTGWTYSG